MANGTDTNTSGAFHGYLKPRPVPKGSCIDPALITQLAALFEVIVVGTSPTVIRSKTAPTDLRATWQEINDFGLPVGAPKQYNRNTGQWGSVRTVTSQSGGASFCLAEATDNVATVDERGCLYVPSSGVPNISPREGNLIQADEQGWFVPEEAIKIEISEDDDNAIVLGADNKPFVKDESWTWIGPFGTGAPCNGVPLPGNPSQTPQVPFDLRTISEYNAEKHQYALVWARITIEDGNAMNTGTLTNPACRVRAGHDEQEITIIIDADPEQGANTCESWVRLNPDPAAKHQFKYRYEAHILTASLSWNSALGRDSCAAYIKAFK